jgi:hypothetical protein
MSDDALRAWQFHIDDMIGFADKAIAYTNGLDQDRFVQSGLPATLASRWMPGLFPDKTG